MYSLQLKKKTPQWEHEFFGDKFPASCLGYLSTDFDYHFGSN